MTYYLKIIASTSKREMFVMRVDGTHTFFLQLFVKQWTC